VITLNSLFDAKKLAKMSTIECGVAILKYAVDDEIPKAKLTEFVANKKKISVASVNGTLYGGNITPMPHKLMGSKEFKKNWVTCKSSTGQVRFVRKTSKKNKPEEHVILSYDTEGKREARKNGVEKYLKKFKKTNPIILTMAGPEALDVKSLLNVKPNAIIHNVDNNPNVLEFSMKLGLPMLNYFGNISSLVENMPKEYYDIINYDSDGYLSNGMAETLKTINRKRAGKYVCLTLQNLKNIRNHGKFANYLREKYGKYDNPTLMYLYTEPMTNYEIVDAFTYNRNQDNMRSKSMRTIVYKRKEK